METNEEQQKWTRSFVDEQCDVCLGRLASRGLWSTLDEWHTDQNRPQFGGTQRESFFNSAISPSSRFESGGSNSKIKREIGSHLIGGSLQALAGTKNFILALLKGTLCAGKRLVRLRVFTVCVQSTLHIEESQQASVNTLLCCAGDRTRCESCAVSPVLPSPVLWV